MQALKYAATVLLILMTQSSDIFAQSAPPEGVLGRWELYAVAGGSPLEVFEFGSGQRQQIQLFADHIEIWGPQPWGSHLENPVVVRLEWAAGSVVFNAPPGFDTWPVSDVCSTAGVKLDTGVSSNPYGVSCTDPPCLMIGPGLSCPDAGRYFYVKQEGVPVESNSLSAIKALYR